MTIEIAKLILSFVVLINPFSALPIFLDMTQNYSKRERRKVAKLSSFSVFVVVVVFALTGKMLLKAFGISTGSLQIGGGILLFLIAASMVSGGTNPAKPEISTDEDSEITVKRVQPANLAAISVVPLAIPMMIGPGGISTVVIYSVSSQGWWDIVAMIVAGGVISLMCYLTLLAAAKVSGILGETGLTILNRVMGMLLAAVAVEIVVAGIRNIFPHLVG